MTVPTTPPPTEPEVLTGTIVPSLRLYQMSCTPTTAEGPIAEGVFTVVAAASKSSEATRKVVKFFQQLYAPLPIIGIEVTEFRAVTSLSDTIVVV